MAFVCVHITDMNPLQSAAGAYQGHLRATCPSPEDREATLCSSRDSGYAAPDSPRSSASSQDQSRFFTNASISNYRKPEYETESDDSQGPARALGRLHISESQSATIGPGSTKRKWAKAGSDESSERQMKWRTRPSEGVSPRYWPLKRRR